jgi:succinoglycan biosynthesis transport protein ExoP
VEPQSKEVHLRDYLNVILKHRWTVLALTAVVVAFVTIKTLTTTYIYRATCQILIERGTPNIVSFQDVFMLDSSTDYYQTQYRLLQSPSLVLRAIENLNLENNPLFYPLPAQAKEGQVSAAYAHNLNPQQRQSALISTFLGGLKINPIDGTLLVDISFESPHPELAATAANGLAEAYIEQNLELKIGISQDAIEFLTKKIDELRVKVEESESALERYKEEKEIITVEEREMITPQKLAELNSQLLKAQLRRVELETLYNQIEKLSEQPEMVESTPRILDSRFIQSLKSEKIALEKEYSKINRKYGPKHPAIIRLSSQIATIKQKIELEVSKIVNSIKVEYELSKARENVLKRQFEEMKRQALELSKKGIEYAALKRLADSNREVYGTLLKRLRETDVTEDIETLNIRIVDRAEVPRSPVRPAKSKNIMLSVIVGLTLGIGLAFLLEYMDNTIKTHEDIEQRVQLPFLGTIPTIRFNSQDNGKESEPSSSENKDLITSTHPRSTSSEAYRSVRTSALLSTPESPPGKILIASAVPYEGKTITAANLAITMAQAGGKTLLLDTDLRKPRIHQIFTLDNTTGLSNIITTGQDPLSFIKKTDIPNLNVLTSGPIPPNPAELLGSNRMHELMKTFAANFDRIILDSPPLIVVTDASILSTICDGVILVVQANRTGLDVIQRGKELLQDVNARIIGVVLNNMDIERGRYFYYYPYYRYYYHRYYESGSEERAPRDKGKQKGFLNRFGHKYLRSERDRQPPVA